PTLPREHRMPVHLRENLDALAGLLDPRGPDEHRTERLLAVSYIQVGFEARDLPSERIAPYRDVGETKVVAVEQDHPRAGTEDRPFEALHRLVEPVEPHQPAHCRRFAARHDQ